MPVPILVSGPDPLHQKLEPGITPNRHQHGIEPESCRVASMPIDRLVKPSEGTVQVSQGERNRRNVIGRNVPLGRVIPFPGDQCGLIDFGHQWKLVELAMIC